MAQDKSYDDEREEDFSDVLEIPAGLTEESKSFRAHDSKGRWLRAWTTANACVTAALFLESAVGPVFLDSETDLYVFFIWGTFVVAKLLGSAFLYGYWTALAPGVTKISRRRAALLNLIPGFELYWSYVVFRGAATAGVKTLEQLDGNRLQYRAPTRLATLAWAARIVALALYGAFVVYALVEADELNVWGALTVATIFFSAAFVLVVPGLAFFIPPQFTLWLIVAQVAALVSIGARMATMWRMSRIAEVADDVRNFAERHATEEERAKERERLERLFNRTNTEPALDGEPQNDRDASENSDRI